MGSHSLRNIILKNISVLIVQIYITNNFVPFTYLDDDVVKFMPDWWYDFMVVINFSACYEHANVFENCALIRLVGKARTSSCKLSNNKDCCCAAGFCAAPRNSCAETTKFRKRLKHVERGSHVEGLRHNSLNLQFQRFSISIDAMHISIDGC